MSLRRMSSSLCSVARSTVTPPTKTGSSTANGVSTPVLPTLTSMLCSRVVTVVGANLKAIAQRGSWATLPSARWSGERVDLDHGAVDVVVELAAALLPARGTPRRPARCRRRCTMLRVDLEARPRAATPGRCGGRAGRAPRSSRWRSTRRRAAARPRAVGSSWRMEPAAELRGFTNARQPVGEALLVEARERGERQVDLAAHLDHRRRIARRAGAAAPSRWCAGWR